MNKDGSTKAGFRYVIDNSEMVYLPSLSWKYTLHQPNVTASI